MVTIQPTTQKAIFDIFVTYSKKISCKTLQIKTQFYLISRICLQYCRSTFSFLTWCRPLEFTFSLDFNISKNSFVFKNNICGSWTAKQTLTWYNSKSTTLHPSIKCKFGTKCYWYCIRAAFTRKFFFFTKNWSFFEIACIFKEIKPKMKNVRQSWTKH